MEAYEEVARAFLANHPLDAARRLELGDPTHAGGVLAAVPPAVGAEVFAALGPSLATACAGGLADPELASILAPLPAHAAIAALRRLDAERRESVLSMLEEEVRSRLKDKLSYPKDTAGELADPQVPVLPSDLSAGDARRHLRGAEGRADHELYIVGRDGTLVGTLSLSQLMDARPRETLDSLMRTDLPRLGALDELPVVLGHPAWTDYDELPVVDPAGRLVGAVRHRTLRRTSHPTQRPMMATLLGLSEAYWAGLSGILASLTPTRPAEAEGDHVS